MLSRVGIVVCAVLSTAACDGGAPPRGAPEQVVSLAVVSELGGPVAGATLTLTGRGETRFDGSGSITIDQPVAGVVRAEGFLDEPIVLDPTDGDVTVRLVRRMSPEGVERRVFHFGGDVMLGRRFQDAGEDSRADTSRAIDAEQARDIVSDVAPLMAVADAGMVNLETVVGELPQGDAYPAKRFLLQSPPVILDALDEMGIDFVALGNNHAYDWQEDGVRSTIEHLDRAGIAWAGAGTTAQQAREGRIIDVRGLAVGVISATTVNGDFVNESLPVADDPIPADLGEVDAWQYEERTFGFGRPGDAAYVARDDRRAGEMWRVFDGIEASASADAVAELWAAMTVAYPELQDWVARRGHGGAAPLERSRIAEQIADLRAQGAGMVIVQIHGGFQFSEVPSDFMRRAAHAAIDGGADLVVGHHPHVLQGFEWYGGKLIAYSLGNFVFDQDFLATFPSVVLRTVFEGSELLEASVVPLVIDRYRPVPVSGEAAQHVIRLMNASSALPAMSDRLQPSLVASVLSDQVVPTASVVREGATARVGRSLSGAVSTVSLGDEGQFELPACTLLALPPDAPPRATAGIEVGVDLLGWGSLDDHTADRASAPAMIWTTNGSVLPSYDKDRRGVLALEADDRNSATARQVARSALPEYVWYDVAGDPVGSAPEYTLQLDVLRLAGAPLVRLTLFDVNDTDPTVEPTSVAIHEAEIDVPGSPEGEWTTVYIDLTDVINGEYGGLRPEAVLVYVVAPPPEGRASIDSVHLYEWRPLSELPENAFVAADALRGAKDADVKASLRGCP